MKLIKIKALQNSIHLAVVNTVLKEIPEGWAVIPDEMETPNFPYGDLSAEEIVGVMTVTSWTPGEMPEPIPEPEPEPTADELIDILLGVSTNE
jgi:hypothetical protein